MKADPPLVTTTLPEDEGGEAHLRPEPPLLLRGLFMTKEESEADETIGLWLVIKERVVGEMGADRLMP